MTGVEQSAAGRAASELRYKAKVLVLAYCQIANRPIPDEARLVMIVERLLAHQADTTGGFDAATTFIEALACMRRNSEI